MKESEKRLLILSLGLMAVIGGIILSQKLRSWQHALAMQETALAAERVDSDALLAEAPLWKERGEWLAQHQPVTTDAQGANFELLNTLVDKAKAAGISAVINNQLQAPVPNEFYQQVGVTLTVKSDLSNVFRWIYSAQSPTEFLVVPYLKITPDKEDATKVVCAVQFWRWYQPKTT